MADHAHDGPAPELPLNHELSDADPKPILKFLAFLVVITIGIAGIIVVVYNYLERREAAEKTARYPMSLLGAERPLPPPPRLQTYPFQDVKELRQTEAPLLTSYEWVDKNAGTVRIPIERAIEVLAERGLPYRKQGEPSAGPPTPAPGSQPAAGTGSGASAPSSGSQAPTGGSSGQPPPTARPPQP